MDALLMPLSQQQSPPQPQPQSQRAVTAPVTGSILVLDDNTAVRQATVAMLVAAGYHCVGVADSMTALCAMVEHQPLAVIVDAESGPLQPWQFAQLVLQHPNHLHVRLIYTSKYDDVIERAKATAANIEAFLAKPFSAEELLAVLATPAQVVA
jgi:CheY-like chemotaxis protein